MSVIGDAKVLIIAVDGFEQSELVVPRDRLKEAGAKVDIAAPTLGSIRGWQDNDWGDEVPVDLTLDDVHVETYDVLVLPGGQINPDVLRLNEKATRLIGAFVNAGKVVAAICHAPWLLAEIDAIRGREVTSYKSIRKDLENAGARWRDAEIVADNGIITSRSPEDLDAFVGKILDEIEERGKARMDVPKSGKAL